VTRRSPVETPCPKSGEVRMIAEDNNRNSFRVRMDISRRENSRDWH
jgi:hypothetical protein